MSESGNLLLESRKRKNSDLIPDIQFVSNSTFKEFKEVTIELNQKIIENVQMMLGNMVQEIKKLEYEIEENQKRSSEKVIGHAKTVQKNIERMHRKQPVCGDLTEKLKPIVNDVLIMEQKQHAGQRIFVKFLSGQTDELSVMPDETVGSFKVTLWDKSGTPPNRQRLIYEGQQLENDKTLEFYDIPSEGTVYGVVRLGFGPCLVCARGLREESNNVDSHVQSTEDVAESLKGLVSELHKLQFELSKNIECSSPKLVSNSNFEEFQNKQNKFNKKLMEVLRMIRETQAHGMTEIVKNQEKHEKMNQKKLDDVQFGYDCLKDSIWRRNENVPLIMEVLQNKIALLKQND